MMAAHVMARGHGFGGWDPAAADVGGKKAAGVEMAPRRRGQGGGRLAPDRNLVCLAGRVGAWCSAQERLSVGMPRRTEHLVTCS